MKKAITFIAATAIANLFAGNVYAGGEHMQYNAQNNYERYLYHINGVEFCDTYFDCNGSLTNGNYNRSPYMWDSYYKTNTNNSMNKDMRRNNYNNRY